MLMGFTYTAHWQTVCRGNCHLHSNVILFPQTSLLSSLQAVLVRADSFDWELQSISVQSQSKQWERLEYVHAHIQCCHLLSHHCQLINYLFIDNPSMSRWWMMSPSKAVTLTHTYMCGLVFQCSPSPWSLYSFTFWKCSSLFKMLCWDLHKIGNHWSKHWHWGFANRTLLNI